jgi:hypothetical protein
MDESRRKVVMENWYKDVWRLINSHRTSTGRTADGLRTIRDPGTFRSLSLSKQESVNAIIEEHQKQNVRRVLGEYDTLADVKLRSSKIMPAILTNFGGDAPLLKRVRDSIMSRDISPYSGGGLGGVSNSASQSGVFGQDPALANRVTPNIWIAPMEAAAIFSQKGVPETIIRKKSQSILLNGVKIKNPKLTPDQLERVKDSVLETALDHKIAESIRDSLVQGGGLLYPMFKRDTPGTMGLPIQALAKLGIVGKGCIDYYTSLDRWNVVHIPNWNPTQKDYLDPQFYYVPFLGADVAGARCGRIVTAPQASYWGNLMTLGWGISDIPGWIESVYNYYNVMQSIPTMINQMSILARTFNVDGLLATEGAAIMDAVDFDETVRIRQVSVNNPINMDVIGDLKAIQRDFKQVPELVRLIRQDAAAKANIPEELIWSSERGAFSSGDQTDSAYEKQSEGTRYIHIDVAKQLKRVAQLAVINALGLDRDVLKALPYTTIEFDNPRLTNAKDKAEVAGHVMKGIFDMVASGVPVDVAVDIGRQMSDNEFIVSNETMLKLHERQMTKDARETEKHEKEMELMDKQIETTGQTPEGSVTTGKPAKAVKPDGEKKGHSYKDPLEQKQHEKVGSGSKQGIQKAEHKKL